MASAPPWWAWGLIAFLGLVWGLNFIFLKLGLEYASPLWLAFLRALLGLAGTAALLRSTRGPIPLDARGRRDAMLIGIPSTAIFYALVFAGLASVLPGIASVLVYTFPLWVALLSPWALRHPLTGRLSGALAVGFAGVVLLSQPWADLHGGISPIAVVELLGGAVAWALGTVLFQRRFAAAELVEANAYQLLGGLIGLGVLVVVFAPTPLPRFTPQLAVDVAWLGLLGTSGAYTIWSYLLGKTRALTLSAYVFLVPIVALIASALVFGERLALIPLLGVALVLLSIYLVGSAPRAHEIRPPDQGSAASMSDDERATPM